MMPQTEPRSGTTTSSAEIAADLREWADWNQQQFSLTLRQWYTGQAIAGICARVNEIPPRTAEQHAHEARLHADALIELEDRSR